METAVERNKFVFATEEARQFQSAFDGFRAAIAKESLLQVFARSNLGHLFREIGRPRLRVIKVGRTVNQLVHLRFCGFDHFRLQWPALTTEIPAKQSRYSPVDIGDYRAAGLFNDDRRDPFTKPVMT